MKTEPKVFKHGGDGNWRCRSQDDKGRWRTAKFVTGKHEPGYGDEPPRVTEKGSFITIPQAIRDTRTAQVEPKPAATPEPQQNAPTPAISEPAKQAEPEIAKQEPSKETSDFPPFCDDARGKGGVILAESEIASPEGAILPPVEPEQPNSTEIPLVEMAIDTMFQLGEQLGGPKAPKLATVEAFSTEGLRNQMVKAAKEVLPSASVEMGPKKTLAACIVAYLGMCYSSEQFRENTAPWYIRAKGKFAGWWLKMKHGRDTRRKAKAEQKETEKENSQNA